MIVRILWEPEKTDTKISVLGTIGFDAVYRIVHHPDFVDIPKILETPYIKVPGTKKSFPPYKYEIDMLKNGIFDENIREKIIHQE